MKSVFSSISTRRMQDEVATLIRNAVMRGDLDFGEHITEQDIAEQMGVSRSPIRDAFHQLEQEGVILRIPNRGCFIADFTEQDVREIFTLRATLERMAIELATPRMTPADVAALQSIIDAQRQAIASEDYGRLTQLDLEFHEFILAKAGHRRLLKAWRGQYVQAQMLLNRRFRVLRDRTPQTVVSDHTAILEALSHGDAQTAMALTRTISERVTAECIKIIRHTELTAA